MSSLGASGLARKQRQWDGVEIAAVARATELAISTVTLGRNEVRRGPSADNLIGSTTTRAGLVVGATVDHRPCPTGKRVSRQEIQALCIERDAFHGDWNYLIRPRPVRR